MPVRMEAGRRSHFLGSASGRGRPSSLSGLNMSGSSTWMSKEDRENSENSENIDDRAHILDRKAASQNIGMATSFILRQHRTRSGRGFSLGIRCARHDWSFIQRIDLRSQENLVRDRTPKMAAAQQHIDRYVPKAGYGHWRVAKWFGYNAWLTLICFSVLSTLALP